MAMERGCGQGAQGGGHAARGPPFLGHRRRQQARDGRTAGAAIGASAGRVANRCNGIPTLADGLGNLPLTDPDLEALNALLCCTYMPRGQVWLWDTEHFRSTSRAGTETPEVL